MRVTFRRFPVERLVPIGCLSVLLAVGCGGAVKTNPLPGGGYVVACEKGITSCISRAEVVCGDKGYTIVGGISSSKVLGGPNSAYRKVAYEGELSFYCGLYQVPKCAPAGAVAEEAQVYQLSAAEPPAAAPAPVPVSTTAPRACVPGTTQTCVGAGACAGGQVCTADGLGFGPCDCGVRAPAEPLPPPAPAEPRPNAPEAAPPGAP